jgi:hypothetical protein
MQHQRRGLIPRIVGAVTEKNARAREACRAAGDQRTYGEGAAVAPRAAVALRAGAPLRAARCAPGSPTCME